MTNKKVHVHGSSFDYMVIDEVGHNKDFIVYYTIIKRETAQIIEDGKAIIQAPDKQSAAYYCMHKLKWNCDDPLTLRVKEIKK